RPGVVPVDQRGAHPGRHPDRAQSVERRRGSHGHPALVLSGNRGRHHAGGPGSRATTPPPSPLFLPGRLMMAQDSSPDTTARPVLLIVEDDLAFARTLSRSFERRGYQVATASGLDEMQAQLETLTPTHAVVDLKLKGDASGLACVQALH